MKTLHVLLGIAWITVVGIAATVVYVMQRYPGGVSQASVSVRHLFDHSATYFRTWDGEPEDFRFPDSAGPTPSFEDFQAGCRPNGRSRIGTPEFATNPTWVALGMSDREYESWVWLYESSGSGEAASFTAYAFGDMDCDGVYSTFSRRGVVTADGVRGAGGIYVASELE